MFRLLQKPSSVVKVTINIPVIYGIKNVQNDNYRTDNNIQLEVKNHIRVMWNWKGKAAKCMIKKTFRGAQLTAVSGY